MRKEQAKKGKILIIEDTIDVINMVRTALMSQNYQVLVATNGQDGLKSATLAQPDLILLDILMPEIDGYATCKLLKENDSTNEIPILFMSALTEVFDKVKAFKLGAVDYITKPLHVEELLARVGTHVMFFQMKRKLEATNQWLEEEVEKRTLELKTKNIELNERNEELQAADEEIRAVNEELYVNNQKLAESEKKYRELAENMPDIVISIDKGYVVNYLNRKINNIPVNQIMGKSLTDIDIKKNWKEQIIGLVDSIIKNKEQIVFEQEVAYTDKLLHFRCKANPLIRKGQVEGMILIVSDITDRKLAEVEVLKEKNRVTNILQSTNAGSWDWNIATNEVSVDERWANIIGYTLNELSPLDPDFWRNNLHPHDVEKTVRALTGHVNGESEYYDTEYRQKHKDGSWVWINARGKITEYSSDGKAARMYGTHLDISARKEVEEALLSSEKQFRALAEQSPNMIFINKKGKVVYANRMCEHVMGYTLQEFYADDFDFMDLIAPESEKVVKAAFNKHQNQEDVMPYEMFILTKSKNKLDVILSSALIDYDGEPAILGVITDITELKKAEIALVESEERFKAFMNYSPFFAYIKDNSLEHIYSNKNIVEVFELEKSGNDSAKGLFDPELSKQLEQADREILDGKAINKTIEYQTKIQGEQRWLKDIKFPIEMPDETVLLGGLAIDITEQKEYEKELERYKSHLEVLVKERTDELEASNEELKATNEELFEQKAKLEKTIEELNLTQNQLVQSEKMASLGVLVAGVAHEINNPVNFINSSLTGIKNNLEYLAGYTELYGQIQENTEEIIQQIKEKEKDASLAQIMDMFYRSVEIIEIGIERTTKIVKGLKAFARANEKKLTKYNVLENLDNTLLILYSQFKNKAKIIKKYNELPLIECYAGQINQVLMNIINNAIQAIDSKGEITITTNLVEPEKVEIVIEDTGKGIPQDHLSQIFDPFFTTKPVGDGTGLGLSISYGIIQDHNGTIEVMSELGKGSCFKITLPVSQE